MKIIMYLVFSFMVSFIVLLVLSFKREEEEYNQQPWTWNEPYRKKINGKWTKKKGVAKAAP